LNKVTVRQVHFRLLRLSL